MRYGLAIIGLSLIVGLLILAGFACARYVHGPLDSRPSVRIWAEPEIAFAGKPVRITVRASASEANCGMIIAVDGGDAYLTISSYELMPNVANTRTLELRPQSANEDGSVLITATLLGPNGPAATADKLIYRRQ